MAAWTRVVSSRATGLGISAFARLVTGVQPRWIGCGPSLTQRIYLANHTSHGDFVLIWSSMPPTLRARTRPVAGSDYWDRGRMRRFIIQDVFNAVLIDREAGAGQGDPIGAMRAALDEGSSLILFPEGTRNTTDEVLLPLKSGIYHLARQRPDVELVPVWIENLNRVLPKGEVIPVPLLCRVSFGAPMRLGESQSKADFLDALRTAMLSLGRSIDPVEP